ncbi:MAG: hypothetical protein IRZ05_13695 [Micromonosporaceae bacterium]|nr:hypothetical protein [Micromonosporaceae bacterium]
MSQEQRRPKQLPGSHLVAALVLAVLVPCGTTSVVARAYAACDVGVNASANAFGFMAVLPVLAIVYAVVHGLALVVAYAVTGRWMMSPALRAGVSVLTTVVVVVVFSWAYFALAGLPLRNALCPAGEPPWWPYWLPPSHDVYP